MNHRLLIFLGVIVFLYIGVCVYFRATQVQKILAPLAEIPTDPKRMGMDYDPVKIPLRDGADKVIAELDGYWVPVESPEAPVILYLHGQDATIGKNLEHTERFHQFGWNVLVIDYRGFGASYGKEQPSEEKIYEDALAALKYLKSKFASNKIFIYGHSLGGAVAIELAKHPDSSDTAGVIVESTFTSILDMSSLRYGGLLQALPVSLLLTEKFDSLSKISSVKLPILFIHGDSDAKVPCEMTETLYAASRETYPKCIIKGAGHENCGSIGKVQYREHIVDFVEACLSKAEPSDARGVADDAVSNGSSSSATR